MKSSSLVMCGLFIVLGLRFGYALPLPQEASSGARDYLANNVVLIVRHAEKPVQGRELTAAGRARAQAYAQYFEPFHENGLNFRVDALFAGADSESSVRPRLTLEPLSRVAGMELNTSVSTKAPDELVKLLRTRPHGTHPLIAWRHGQIPALLTAFGASATILPDRKWPDDTYDWVLVLRFDAIGKLYSAERITEHLVISPS